MAIVLKPPKGQTSPQLAFGGGAYEIDWSIAPRGLKVFFLNNTNSFPELVRGSYNAFNGVLYNGTPLTGMTAYGPAFDPNQATNPAIITSIVAPAPTQCSAEVFIYYTALDNNYAYCRINEQIVNSGTWDRAVGLDITGHPFFYIFDGAANQIISPTALTAGNFYHLVGTATGSSVNIYVNGVLANTGGAASGGYAGFTFPIFTQGYGDTRGAAGRLPTDPILYCAFADQAWTAAEVSQRYADPYAFLIPAEGEMPALFTASITIAAFGSTLPMMGVG